MNDEAFFRLYAAASGWTEDIVTDENLSPDYPVALYDFSGKRVLTLCPEMEEYREDLSPDMSLNQILSTLFEMEGISVDAERVLGFYAGDAVSGEDLPDLTDAAALKKFKAVLPRKDRIRGAVTLQDDFTSVITKYSRILAAAGAVCEGRLADLSVSVLSKSRCKGYGARAVASVCQKAQAKGFVPVYRVEESNTPSLKLAQHLGLHLGFTMEGALLHFPDAEETG